MAEKVGDIYVNISARLEDLEKEFGKLDRTVKKKTSKLEKSVGGAFKKIGALAAGAFAVNKIMNFTNEAIRLAGEMEGVESAFNRLNAPGLLKNLQEATQNTVSDLQLMKAAVKAQNFKVPLDKLAGFFEFATKRAAQTGESVDYLVESIINGIGRKSSLVLDNLGISATELQAEIKEVGDFGLAAGNIIERELGKMGDVALTSAQKTAQLNAALEKTTIAIGEKLTPAANAVKEAWISALGTVNVLLDDNLTASQKLIIGFADQETQAYLLKDAYKELVSEQEAAARKSEAFKKNQDLLNKAVELGLIKLKDSKLAYSGLTDEQFNVINSNRALLLSQEELTDEISETEQAIRDLLSAEEVITIGNTRIAESFVELGAKGTEAVTGLLNFIPQLQPVLMQTEEGVKAITAEGQLLVDVMGMGLQQSFEAALINGESFTETLGQYFINLVQRILAAAAAAAVLAAILSATGLGGGVGFLGGFKSLFGGFSGLNIPGFGDSASIGGGSSLASPSGGGTVNVTGSISGNDIVLSNDRTTTTRTRTRG